MVSTSKITEIFFIIDEFCKKFEKAKAGVLSHLPKISIKFYTSSFFKKKMI